MDAGSLLNLFAEIIDHIVGYIDHPADVLSLGCTCRTLKDICIPDHLCYRRICVSDYEDAILVWQHLIAHPLQARNVRVLEVGKRTRIHIPNKHARHHYLYSTSRTELRQDAQAKLSTAISIMSGLLSFSWLADGADDSWWLDADGEISNDSQDLKKPTLWPVCRLDNQSLASVDIDSSYTQPNCDICAVPLSVSTLGYYTVCVILIPKGFDRCLTLPRPPSRPWFYPFTVSKRMMTL